jgi:hypothetical protein
MSLATEWTNFAKSQILDAEFGEAPIGEITEQDFVEFGVRMSRIAPKVYSDPEPDGTEDRLFYRMFFGLKGYESFTDWTNLEDCLDAPTLAGIRNLFQKDGLKEV